MAARRRWVPIAFGLVVLLVFIGIGAMVAVTAWFQQNVEVEDSTASAAQSEFDAVRQKYSARPPLLEVRDGRPHYSPGTTPSSQSPAERGATIEALYILAWDPDDQHLARVTVPFWLLRLKRGPIAFSSYASGVVDKGVNLRVEDLEKHGPGLLLDTTSSDGDRVLIWAQ